MAQDLLARMANRAGVSLSDARAKAALGAWTGVRKLMKPIEDSDELMRIISLPRRDWTQFDAWLIQAMTEWLKVPGGQQELRLLQAVALAELHDYRGLLAPIRVGGGKTLITFLAPVVMEAQRPLLIVPGGLLKKTERDFEQYALHWKRHPNYQIRSYEWISRIGAADFFDTYQPDFVAADEVHKVSNRDAACTRRVERYMEANPDVVFMGLSGTITKHSIMDFHHLLRWSHGEHLMPMPKNRGEAALWASALDPETSEERRPLPGALVRLLPEGKRIDKATTDDVREAFGERLKNTPAIVSTTTEGVDASIIYDLWDPDLPDEILAPIEHLYTTNKTPNGEELESKLDVWRHAREMIMGFYYQWIPPAPEEWLLARATWSSFVRDTIALNTKAGDVILDSPQQVEWAVRNGLVQDFGVLRAWLNVKDTFKPNPVPQWITDEMLHKVKDRVQEPTLVWTSHRAIGEALSKVTGWAYFGQGGVDSRGRYIGDCPNEIAILSIDANKEGRNLQNWNKNLILNCPASASTLQQLIGRTHREGQQADEVYVEILIGHRLLENAFQKACTEARFLEQVQQEPQKILQADFAGRRNRT